MREQPTPTEIKTYNMGTRTQRKQMRSRFSEELAQEAGLEKLEEQLDEAESNMARLANKRTEAKRPSKKLIEEHDEAVKTYNVLEGKVDRIEARIKKFLSHFQSKIKDTKEAGTMAGLQVKEGTLIYQALNRLKITDSRGLGITKTLIEDTGLVGMSVIVQKPDSEFFNRGKFADNRLETHYNGYLEANPDKADNIKKAIKKINSANDLQKTIERTKKRTEIMKVDYKDFFGLKDMSKKSNRAKIYNFWEGVSNQFTDVEAAYEKLMTEAKNADMFTNLIGDIDSEIEGLEEDENAKRIKLQDDKRIVEKKKEAYEDEINNIEEFKKNNTLEYLVSVPAIPTEEENDELDKLIEACLRFEAAEALAGFYRENNEEEEEDLGKEAWERLYESGGDGPAKDNPFDAASLDEELVMDSLDDKFLTNVEATAQAKRLLETDIDPLLAIELKQNKKLIGLTEKSISSYKELIEELKEGETDIEYLSNYEELLEQVEDSLIIEQEEYVLPISTFRGVKGGELGLKTFVGAVTKESINLDQIGRKYTKTESSVGNPNINELFSMFHRLFTDDRYSFLRYTRTERKRTGGGQIDRQKLRPTQSLGKKKVLRIFNEYKRQSPTIPAREGRIMSGLSDTEVGKALASFLKACSKYYIEPFNKGMTPYAYPRYLSGEGAKALSAIALELGYETLLGTAAKKLATTANVQITAGDMQSVANFLSIMNNPSLAIDNSTIRSAERAADALTAMFGKKEDNYNAVSFILVHYMKKLDMKIKGKGSFANQLLPRRGGEDKISTRAKKYENTLTNADKLQESALFALPAYLEMNQGLLTRNDAIKRHYRIIEDILEEVDDDRPEVLMKLLKAHDEIRKAMGKKVTYGTLSLAHNSYDRIIDIMYKQENIDLSHLEVENIVKAVDSHNNIAKEYGISSEQVYLIKANFR
jgi:hypothetical protein